MARTDRIEPIFGMSGAHAPVAAPHPSRERSVAHATVLFAILLAMSLGFGAAWLGDSPVYAVAVLLVVLISAAVLSVAWMRPPGGSPEHHPRIDHLLDDTSP